jgi:hypothetical protein
MAFYIRTKGFETWQTLLADPVKHWRTGYSARTLAAAWEAANGLPPEIRAHFGPDAKMLIGIPEHKVELPGGGRPSQTDLFALIRTNDSTIAAAIEGKVDEPFGPTIGEWLIEASPGKQQRLDALCTLLGLRQPLPKELRYQLLHRAASAVLEAQRFKTDEGAMIVHSFSPTSLWFDDFSFFVSLLGGQVTMTKGFYGRTPTGMPMLYAWAKGDPKFLAA